MKLKYIFIILIILFLISPFFIPIKLNQINSSTIILDEKGIEIWEIVYDERIRHREIKFGQIPDFIKDSIILIEDKSFFSNLWIDFSSIFRAIYNNIKSDGVIEWASTISTQVIRNNYWLNKDRTYFRKILEFYLAISLNLKYSKQEILENYLNNIYFWYLNYWIQSASKYYFDREINNLTKAEQLALIILPKNSSKYDPYTNYENFKYRFDKIVDYLSNEWLFDTNEAELIKLERLDFNYEHKSKLPYVVDYIRSPHPNPLPRGEGVVQSTIDYNLTKKIDEIAKNTIIPLMWKDMRDYWILILDRNTNDLKVMIWWVNYYANNWQVNSTTSLRQVGSTLKPFTYLLAFKDLWYSTDTKILDLPVQFDTVDWNTYSPQNYSLDYKWEVTLAEALSQSINVPAVKLLNEIGIARLYNFLKQVWINSLNEDIDYYWLALTLWVWEISLYELLQAYSIFANEGNFCEIGLTPPPSGTSFEKGRNLIENNNCIQVIELEYIDMVNIILTNRYFKLAWFPINSNLDFENKEVFVKTGTSRNFRDNYAIWFTDNYMIWVWAWNKDGTYMKWVSWASWAWEIFKNIVNYLEENDDSREKIVYEDNKYKYVEIVSPLDKSIYKIEELRKDNQEIKLDFETNVDFDYYKWYINWEEYNKDFFKLERWSFEIKLVLYENWKEIKDISSNILVE